jgi:thioredoxin 1
MSEKEKEENENEIETINKRKFEELLLESKRNKMRVEVIAKPDGKPIPLTDANFSSEVLKHQVMVVDFWAPWCGPCRMIAPVVEELSRQYSGRLRVTKVNTDENPRWASSLGIQAIPTLMIYKNGQEVDRIVGATTKQALQKRVEQAMVSNN